jgi:polysaccharide export outer membrane protein
LIIALWIVQHLVGCAAPPKIIEDEANFGINPFKKEIPFATPEVIRAHEANLKQEYLIGPGDQLRVDVWNRARLSGDHVVGPYGKITLPMMGVFHIGGLTRTDAAAQITDLYRNYYDDPLVNVKILKLPSRWPAGCPPGTKPFFCPNATSCGVKTRLSGSICCSSFKKPTSN